MPPTGATIKAGFKGPFRTWVKVERAQLDKDYNIISEDQQERKNIIETIDYVGHAVEQYFIDPTKPVIYTGIDEGVEIIAKSIREQGPFDGVLSFSQGSVTLRKFFDVTQTFRPEPYKDLRMPYFVISVAGAVGTNITHRIEGKVVWQMDHNYALDSLHIYGT